MDTAFKPRLRHCTMLDEGAGLPLRLIVGASHFDLSETVGERETFLRLKSLFDGRHTVTDIIERSDLEPAAVHGIIDQFQTLGLLRRETPVSLIAAPELKAQLGATLTMWRNQIGYHRLFQGLTTGEHRTEILQGLFIETYHLVSSAARHISVAVAAAQTEHDRQLLSTYFAEEYDHSAYMFDTCVRLGLNEDALRDSHPVVGTESLIQMLCEIGRTDTLAYFAALGLFEAVSADEAEGRTSVGLISGAYGLPAATFAPALAHLQMDIEAGHNSMLDLALDAHENVPADRVHRIVNLLHDLKHAYDQMHDGILLYYGDVSNYVPRPKVDYFSL